MTLRPLLFSAAALLALSATGRTEEKKLLYLTSPDGAQIEGMSGEGILVFDIEDGFKFVRRIAMPPAFKEGVRGFCANAATHRAFYSTSGRHLGCWDFETEKVVWEKEYENGVDRVAVTPDGKKLYAPTGWWVRGEKSGWMVLDAADGQETNRIKVADQSHNTIASLDGKFAYLGSLNEFRQVSTADDSVVKLITGVGEGVVYPFTVDKKNERAFICLGKHAGFEVVDLKEGKILHKVLAGEKPIEHRTHGAGLTPDAKELWISDPAGKELWIFDLTVMPPKPAGSVDLGLAGHGWITFTIDGKYALSHASEVIETKTRKVVATLKDETGKPVASSKFIEVHFRDGKVTAVGDQFGLER